MKRTLPAYLFSRLPAILLVCLSSFGVLVMLCMLCMLGCAGLPEALQAELEEARTLVEIASPASLERAASLLSDPGLGASREAAILGARARLLYDFLYPERAGALELPESFAASPEDGELFSLAARGQAPPGPPEPEVKEAGYFDLLLPALYTVRQPALSRAEALALGPLIERAGRLNPQAVLPLYLSGLLAEALDAAPAARESYRRCLELETSFYPAHRRLADLEYIAGDLDAAADHLQALRELGLADTAALLRLARIYLEKSRLEQAEALTAEELMRSPGDRELLMLRSSILEARGEWPQALRLVEMILKQAPDYRPALIKKVELLAAFRRDPEEVLRALRDLDITDDPELLELSGRTLLAAGRHEEGLSQLQRALELEPGRASVLRALAEDAAATQRWLQAEAYLARLPAESTGEPDLLLAHLVYGRLGNNRKALEIAGRLYDDGGRPEHTLLYAETLLANQRRATLRAFITSRFEAPMSPEIKSGLLYLQALLLEENDPDRLQTLQLSLLSNPDNEKALAAIAALYLEIGDARKARNYLRRVLALNPSNPALSVQLRRLEPEL